MRVPLDSEWPFNGSDVPVKSARLSTTPHPQTTSPDELDITMSQINRRKQNREAQRRFREKQVKQAQQSKEEFERLTSRYEALLAENESLRTQTMTQYHSTAQTPKDSIEELDDPVSLEWDSMSLPPSQVADFMQDFETEILSAEAFDLQDLGPQVDETAETQIELPKLPENELRGITLPATGFAPTTVHDTLGSDTQRAQNYIISPLNPTSAWSFSNSFSALNHGACDETVFPSPWHSFGPGSTDASVGSIPRVDLVQALMQVACTQERIALIDLERAKLRVCEC